MRSKLTVWACLGVLAVSGGCSSADEPDVAAEVRARYETFPSGAQPPRTRPWPDGRFTGECSPAVHGVTEYACFYADAHGREGFVCVATGDGLDVTNAVGPFDRREWVDHAGRPRPPEAVC